MTKTDKQILRSRAVGALAQDDKRGRAFETGMRTDGFSSSSFHAAGGAVILSAEGAKDLLLGIVND
jgi:hypothetical protein